MPRTAIEFLNPEEYPECHDSKGFVPKCALSRHPCDNLVVIKNEGPHFQLYEWRELLKYFNQHGWISPKTGHSLEYLDVDTASFDGKFQHGTDEAIRHAYEQWQRQPPRQPHMMMMQHSSKPTHTPAAAAIGARPFVPRTYLDEPPDDSHRPLPPHKELLRNPSLHDPHASLLHSLTPKRSMSRAVRDMMKLDPNWRKNQAVMM